MLAHSGGPDSTALLHLLIENRVNLHIAHVDHGWRQESGAEAAHLSAQAERLGIPFHLKSLSMSDFKDSNLEEQGRQKRFAFFAELYQALGAQALLLGHHQDDQAEVVLKRLFEGASLSFLAGMSPESELYAMNILRPLLCTHKKTLLSWLRNRQIAYFEDVTNRDPRYLRARMREHLIPLLEESFGKRIAKNLCQLGEEAEDLRNYFLELNAPLLRQGIHQGSIDVEPYLPLSRVQLRFLLKEWARHIGIVLQRGLLEEALSFLLQEKKEEKQFFSSRFIIKVNRSVVTLNKINV